MSSLKKRVAEFNSREKNREIPLYHKAFVPAKSIRPSCRNSRNSRASLPRQRKQFPKTKILERILYPIPNGNPLDPQRLLSKKSKHLRPVFLEFTEAFFSSFFSTKNSDFRFLPPKPRPKNDREILHLRNVDVLLLLSSSSKKKKPICKTKTRQFSFHILALYDHVGIFGSFP
ncbi:hypothetical protein LEP1GSC040_3287 [Leptospira santarosai str. 2000030832]|nr:hypothetical protein LEP1GSC040_3287 [Leptospira santarosai str. 2000030832]